MATFKYQQPDPVGVPVAYIDGGGDLVVRQTSNIAVCILSGQDHRMKPAASGLDWDPGAEDVKRRFYPGDCITITF